MLMLFDELSELSKEADPARLFEALQQLTPERANESAPRTGFRRTGPLRKA
ncbi:MAG: hypothetical protein ACJAYU_004046 [Bradymonadia bacterium]|jgi:hypothetical protein